MIKNTQQLLRILCVIAMMDTMNAEAQNTTYNIKGTVIDSTTRKPLAGVYITTGEAGGQSNSKGEYHIKGVEQGSTTLKTMYTGDFFIETTELMLTKDTTINFQIRAKILKVDEIVVTGTRTEKRLSDTPILTTVIGNRDIVRSGSTSVVEALQDNIPGMIIGQSAMGTSVNIRGLNTRYIVFLVDGERLIAEGAGGSVNLDQIDINNVAKVEVVNGASSALYGSNAVGAVINIITKKPVHKFQASTNIIGESNNTLKTRASVGFNREKINGTISGFRQASDGFGANGEVDTYAAKYEDYGANIKLGYTPIDRVDLNVTGKYFSHETFNPEESLNVAHPLKHTIGGGINGGYTAENGENNIRLSVNYDKYIENNILELLDNKNQRENEISYISTRIVNTFNPLNKWEVVAGAEFNRESNFSKTTLGETPTTKTIEDYNLFAQAQYEIAKDFDIVAGSRYTYNSQFSSAFSPKVSLMYSIKGFSIRTGVGTAYRAPTIKELYYDFDHQGMFWIYGNPDLKAENGLYTSLSIEYNKKSFNISASPYYNTIKNKITQFDVIDNGSMEKHYINVSSATLQGIDLSASYNFFRQLEL